MAKSLRIVVADDEVDMRDFYQRMLTILGHEVIAVVQNGRELVEFCRVQPPELIVTDVMMPEIDGIDAVIEIWKQQPLAVVVVSAHRDTETLCRLEEAPVMAVLIKPVSRKDLAPVIDLAVLRFHQFRRLCDDSTDVTEALRDRKVVERAKRLLLRDGDIDEADAFDRLQAAAGVNRCKVVDAARMVLESAAH
jgi:response regulator NasT